MARAVTIQSRAGETVIHVGDDGEVSEVVFERLLKANPDWSVVEPSTPKPQPKTPSKRAPKDGDQ